MTVTFGSLFAGIGGFDLGFERAGMVCKWQVEINPFCQKVLKKHWPNVPLHADIRTFPPTTGEWYAPIICGGFPCKQTSTSAAIHRQRSGLAGQDSGLWFEMLRVVRLVRPKIVVVENVGGASTWETTITQGLADAGYRNVRKKPFEMSAKGVGAPHQRRRLFWIAYRVKPRLETPSFPDPPRFEGRQWSRPERHPWDGALPRGVRVADGIPRRLDRRPRIIAIGNAVVPQVSEMIGKYVIQCLEALQK